MCGDTILLFGGAYRAIKKKYNKIQHGLRWPPIDDNTHNNLPKQAAVMDDGMEGRRKQEGAQGGGCTKPKK